MKPAWVTRVAVVVVAAGGIAVAVGLDRREAGCTEAIKQMFFALDDGAAGPRLDATIDGIESDCDGSTRLVDSGSVLFEKGETERAAGLLRVAAQREPENFSAWAGLAAVLAENDPERSRDAADRARALNPGYRPPS